LLQCGLTKIRQKQPKNERKNGQKTGKKQAGTEQKRQKICLKNSFFLSAKPKNPPPFFLPQSGNV
jgi:hypothetical protein